MRKTLLAFVCAFGICACASVTSSTALNAASAAQQLAGATQAVVTLLPQANTPAVQQQLSGWLKWVNVAAEALKVAAPLFGK